MPVVRTPDSPGSPRSPTLRKDVFCAVQRTGRSAARHEPPTVGEAPRFNAERYHASIGELHSNRQSGHGQKVVTMRRTHYEEEGLTGPSLLKAAPFDRSHFLVLAGE
jgi:hypothetical protein